MLPYGERLKVTSDEESDYYMEFIDTYLPTLTSAMDEPEAPVRRPSSNLPIQGPVPLLQSFQNNCDHRASKDPHGRSQHTIIEIIKKPGENELEADLQHRAIIYMQPEEDTDVGENEEVDLRSIPAGYSPDQWARSKRRADSAIRNEIKKNWPNITSERVSKDQAIAIMKKKAIQKIASLGPAGVRKRALEDDQKKAANAGMTFAEWLKADVPRKRW